MKKLMFVLLLLALGILAGCAQTGSGDPIDFDAVKLDYEELMSLLTPERVESISVNHQSRKLEVEDSQTIKEKTEHASKLKLTQPVKMENGQSPPGCADTWIRFHMTDGREIRLTLPRVLAAVDKEDTDVFFWAENDLAFHDYIQRLTGE